MGTNRAGEATVTSVDVAILISQLEEMHYGRFVVELEAVTSSQSRRVRFSVRAACFVGTYRTSRNTRAVVEGSWPSAGHRTLAGCMVQLLHQLDAALEAARRQDRGGVTPLEAAINASVITDNP